MAGLYIHIPFCKQKCHYCDFHISISQRNREGLLSAIAKELQIRRSYLPSELDPVETIYFGGGTPSLLQVEEFVRLFSVIHDNYLLVEPPEITVECNPDDLTVDYLTSLKQNTPVNRLSIGIQSFFDTDLKRMNRSHHALNARDAVWMANQSGFKNITVDLIYGLPQMTLDRWAYNLEQVFSLPIQHLSSYHLTFEPRTVFYHQLQKKELTPVDEYDSEQQFGLLTREAIRHGFVHYEISNFGKLGYFSLHNSNYWKRKNYLGIGPSAHSFNGFSRSWNIAHNVKYIGGINAEQPIMETEQLNGHTRYNDYLLTGLRTMWGIDLNEIEREFSKKIRTLCLEMAMPYIRTERLEIKNERQLVLTNKGKLLADKIISDLFIIDS